MAWSGRMLPRSRPERARLLLVRGLCLEQLGEAEAARATLTEVLDLADELGDDPLRAKAHTVRLALGHLWVGEPEEVRRHATEAIRLAKETGGSVLFWSYLGPRRPSRG